jgi:Kef-type K+ transport system membrane component KefB
MRPLTSAEIYSLFLSVGVLLLAAKIVGEMLRRFHQPAVVGELLAGIVLGPSVLGAFSPGGANHLVPLHAGRVPVLWESLTTVAVTIFLLAAGMEVDLARLRHLKRIAAWVSASGMLLPFVLGLGVAWYVPDTLGRPRGVSPVFFALFFGVALSISALPVIAKTLLDLRLYWTDVGVIIIAAAIVNDFTGWIIFGVLLAMMHGTSAVHASNAVHAVMQTLVFAALVLTAGRWVAERVLRWAHGLNEWAGSIVGFAVALGLLGGAIAEAIGIHALFGAFLVGVAIGNSPSLREEDRTTITRFVSSAFAPLFFVSLGLKIDFVANFDLRLILIVIAVAFTGKLLGARLGAGVGGLDSSRGWAVAAGLNARGAMEIVLATLALQHGLIETRMFVALVLMALVSSMVSGPTLRRILGPTSSELATLAGVEEAVSSPPVGV